MKFIKTFCFVVFLFFLTALPRMATAEQLSWQDCLRLAAQNNPDLVSAREAVEQKKSAIDIVISDKFPQVKASLDASRTENDLTASKNYSYGVSASQVLFDGFKTSSSKAAAKENLKASQQAYRFSDASLRYNVRRAFIEMLQVQELIKTAQEIAKIRRDSLVLITLRFHAGLENKGAVLTAQANLAQAEYESDSASRAKETSRKNLCFNLGVEDDKTLEVDSELPGPELKLIQPDFEALLKDNPSLLQAAAQRSAAQYSISAARADFYPQVSAQLSGSKSGASLSDLDKQWGAGVGLSVPLFEGGLLTAKLAQAKSFYRQAAAQEKSARFSALKTLAQAWQDLNDAFGLVKVREQLLVASNERERISAGRYSAGFIAFDDWIIIEDALVKAKKDCLQAKINVMLANAAWEQAKGETLDYEE